MSLDRDRHTVWPAGLSIRATRVEAFHPKTPVGTADCRPGMSDLIEGRDQVATRMGIFVAHAADCCGISAAVRCIGCGIHSKSC